MRPDLILLCCLCFGFSDCDSETGSRLSDAANCFTVKLYKELGTARQRMVTSPFSAYVLMSMLRVGAGGRTAQELTTSLGYEGLSVEDMQQGFYSKLNELKSSDGNVLDVANSIWIKESLHVEESFNDTVTKKFLSRGYSVDFEGDSPGATRQINDWANTSTHGMIPTLFDQVLSPSTVMVLANAIFFDGTWDSKFKSANTRKGHFYNNDLENDVSEVDLMYQKSRFKYNYDPNLRAQLLEMPYVGKNMSMIFILSEAGFDLESLEKNLTCDALKNSLKSLRPALVQVTVPKFEISSVFKLVDPMKSIGIVDAFRSAANFSGISPDVKISEAIQKCVVKVYEEGSRAAVVTGLTLMKMSLGSLEEPEVFTANHPFLFLIRDHRTDFILFIGRVNEFRSSN